MQLCWLFIIPAAQDSFKSEGVHASATPTQSLCGI